jgi:hypothetical protein
VTGRLSPKLDCRNFLFKIRIVNILWARSWRFSEILSNQSRFDQFCFGFSGSLVVAVDVVQLISRAIARFSIPTLDDAAWCLFPSIFSKDRIIPSTNE